MRERTRNHLNRALIFGFYTKLKLLLLLGFLSNSSAHSGPINSASHRQFAANGQRNLAYVPSPMVREDELEFTAPTDWPSPQFEIDEQLSRLSGEQILDDVFDRVGPEFTIPANLRSRVAFWFDIYTKYNQYQHVIHHNRYPWIVFEVIDFNKDIREGKGPRWLRVDRSRKAVQARRQEIRRALLRLSKNPKAKTEFERQLLQAVSSIPGKRSQVLRFAAASLRSQLGQKDFFLSGLRRSSRYLPHIESIFQSRNLPVDLTRMPFVESSFNVAAESRVGASGIWQVMPATGRAYGIVSEAIDERNSPVKSSQMAAKLLSSYRRALGSWPLAITAYNHGIGNIRVAMRAARSKDIGTIIQRYHRGDFKFASSNFYTCFLAALYAERYADAAFPSLVRDPLIKFETYLTKRRISFRQLSQLTGLTPQEILAHNLDIKLKRKGDVLLPKGFSLHLPLFSADSINDNLGRALQLKMSKTLSSTTLESSDNSI